MPDINITGKERETLIEWLDGEIETVEKYRKVMKRKEERARELGDLSLANTYNRFAYGMQSRIQAFKDVKGREMSKEAEECRNVDAYLQHEDNGRTL